MIPALLGGALIGLSASLLFLANGRVAGISGVVGSLLAPSVATSPGAGSSSSGGSPAACC